MARAVQITGLQKVVMNLKTVPIEVRGVLPGILDEVGKYAKNVAQASVPKDTGALETSIKNKLTKSGPAVFEEQITAGDPNVVRGEGPFTQDMAGYKVGRSPTTEYAAVIDTKGGKGRAGKGYMTQDAMGIAQMRGTRKVVDAVAKVVGRRFAGL